MQIDRTILRMHGFNRHTYICLGFLGMSILLVTYVIYYASGSVLDSDSSSELLLAKHLSDTNRLLSKDWYYGHEIRIFHNQVIYALLFNVFDSFRVVRFAGTIIWIVIFWLSYAYLARQLELKLNTFLVSSAILILPTSCLYASVTSLHPHYVPHISAGFLIVGLFSSIVRKRNPQTFLYYFKIFICLLLCFITAMGGMRQLVITIAPLCASVLFMLLKSMDWSVIAEREREREREKVFC